VSHKGFLPGPYERRTALDEVVQMMGGLAYMTGRPGDPLRAGASVNDIMGGMFGAIGAMAALAERARTGRGQEVQVGLFENNVFLMGQHMMQHAVTGRPAAPMPARVSAWAVYDIFAVKNGQQIFLGVVTDSQWQVFCDAFALPELREHPKLRTNSDRVLAREWLIPILRARLKEVGAVEVAAVFEANGLPYAPITRPEELVDDPHLNASGGLASMTLPGGTTAKVPLLPIAMAGHRLALRSDPPAHGEHTAELLGTLPALSNSKPPA
jgi:crotonobetainyl-CoA:carnitine CoA-transferase CaiB-like acyl-CoA transferase